MKSSKPCPHPHQPYYPYWEGPLTDDLPILNVPEVDEFHCLNLSLTIPKRCLISAGRKIAVLVFIHGGAFAGGSHAIQLSGREDFDGTNLVRHSIETWERYHCCRNRLSSGPTKLLGVEGVGRIQQKRRGRNWELWTS